jgi:hypothetical protein
MINLLTGEPILPAQTANQYLARCWFAVCAGKIGSPVRRFIIFCIFVCIFFSFCVFNFEDFLCAFLAFFLLSGAVCVADLSDVDSIGDNQYGESYNLGNKQYSSKNLWYCQIHRFSESVRPLNLSFVVLVVDVQILRPEDKWSLLWCSQSLSPSVRSKDPKLPVRAGVAVQSLTCWRLDCLDFHPSTQARPRWSQACAGPASLTVLHGLSCPSASHKNSH